MPGSARREHPSAGSVQPAFDTPAYRQVLAPMAAELRRARRFEHPLTMMMISALTPSDDGAKSTDAPSSRATFEVVPTTTLFLLLGSFLRNAARETDILSAAPDTMRYVLLLAETDRFGADRALARFRDGFRTFAGAGLRIGVVEFPRDGLTVQDLFDTASRIWDQNSAQRPTVPVSREVSYG